MCIDAGDLDHVAADFAKDDSAADRKVPEVVSCRQVDLRVDKERGAGLELETDPHGFLVESVDPEPGQDVQAGDVILEIDGVPLWGNLDEDTLADAFGSRFGNGARLRIAPKKAVRGHPVIQPIGIAKL